ncbi:MAG: hypothetical protein ACREMZ_11205 [Gemmatimonadales bacterium]
MATKTTAPSIGELEAELTALQPRLYTLFAAQEAARDDLSNAEVKQRSASGADITEHVLAARKFKAEVEKYTDEIAPLKERADYLKKAIAERKRAAEIARIQTHAKAAQALAPQVAASLDALLEQLAAFTAELNAMGNPDIKAEVRSLARYVEVRMLAAGVQLDYRNAGITYQSGGTSPVDVAAVALSFAETQQP